MPLRDTLRQTLRGKYQKNKDQILTDVANNSKLLSGILSVNERADRFKRVQKGLYPAVD